MADAHLPTEEQVMAYIGRCKCGGVVFASVDKPEYRKSNGEEVADLIAKGFTIAHVPVNEAREAKWCTTSKEHMRG